MDTNENKVSGRASYTDAERRELIEEFHASGMKQVEFCREWNLNPKTLARWLRLERQESGVSFYEVELGASVRTDEVRVCLPNRVELVVPVMTREQLGTLLREAAGCLD
jgi:transposase-like protein